MKAGAPARKMLPTPHLRSSTRLAQRLRLSESIHHIMRTSFPMIDDWREITIALQVARYWRTLRAPEGWLLSLWLVSPGTKRALAIRSRHAPRRAHVF